MGGRGEVGGCCLSADAPLARRREFTHRRGRAWENGKAEGPPAGLGKDWSGQGRLRRSQRYAPRSARAPLGRARSSRFEGPVKIRDEIVDVFDPQRQTHHILTHASLRQLLGIQLTVSG